MHAARHIEVQCGKLVLLDASHGCYQTNPPVRTGLGELGAIICMKSHANCAESCCIRKKPLPAISCLAFTIVAAPILQRRSPAGKPTSRVYKALRQAFWVRKWPHLKTAFTAFTLGSSFQKIRFCANETCFQSKVWEAQWKQKRPTKFGRLLQGNAQQIKTLVVTSLPKSQSWHAVSHGEALWLWETWMKKTLPGSDFRWILRILS